jgi:GNAT superfamily N-acetyltransferase
MDRSDCFGVFDKESGAQVGFARVVTDEATFFWLCDVVVGEEYRGRGAGRLLMEAVRDEAKYRSMLGVLGTRDAHGLYEKFGFVRDADGSFMRKPFGAWSENQPAPWQGITSK